MKNTTKEFLAQFEAACNYIANTAWDGRVVVTLHANEVVEITLTDEDGDIYHALEATYAFSHEGYDFFDLRSTENEIEYPGMYPLEAHAICGFLGL